MANIKSLNTTYFGKDRTHNYIKDDFSKVLRGAIVRTALIEVFKGLDKNRSNTRKLKDGSAGYGDFDPDNAGFFFNIFEMHEKGWMAEVRILLGGKKNKRNGGREKGSGGRFVDDIVKLTVDDFMAYYTKKDSVTIPKCLLGKFYSEKPTDGAVFIESNRDIIESTVSDLIEKSRKFQSSSYHGKIIADYEALELHKDTRPEKYKIREEPTDFPFSNGTMNVRSKIAEVKIKEIAHCLNDFADVISKYQLLVGENTSFFGSNWPLDVFISRTIDIFRKNLPEGTVEKVEKEIIKYLHPAIDIVGWRYSELNTSKVKGNKVTINSGS